MLENNYLELKKVTVLPRLPLSGSIDLTYRCNNNCRHCWLRVSPDIKEPETELSFAEIKGIIDDARAMGCCRRWTISGGEPMLRPDFADIFDYLTRNSIAYSLNTNGTLITPKIAKLLRRKGMKMVALYGATSKVHDHITRNPGSFELTMRGFRYLKEAGAGFTVQLIPMKGNYHQFNDMVKLAESLSRHYRMGAAWFYLSACADEQINAEIMRQRLAPQEVIELDKPDLSYEERVEKEEGHCYQGDNEHLFSACINSKRDFHIDPYGKMAFCCFIKDPGLRYDLRKGNFKKAWDEFIPSLSNKIKITEEYKENCGSCAYKKDCRWCPVYGYLEHGRFNAKVSYLCTVAKENQKFKQNWLKNHRRYFKIADITIQFDSDLPIDENTFHPKFRHFEADGQGEDTITVRHHFSLPDLEGNDLGKEIYRKPPWAIYHNMRSWVYLGIFPQAQDKRLDRVVFFDSLHTNARIYNDTAAKFLKGNLDSLTMFPTDQIWLARVLADRQGFYLHSCGVNFAGKGLLFAGHSEAGKSTMANMLKGKAEILCDDRMIIRRKEEGFKIYGTWSHGDVPDVSGNSAPLKAILFLEKAQENKLILISDKKEAAKRVLPCLIRPLETIDWWGKTLLVVDKLTEEVPCYVLRFDKSGEVVDLLKEL
jgi:radical SAM protein with 4Fe4S-binding SPASM domain